MGKRGRLRLPLAPLHRASEVGIHFSTMNYLIIGGKEWGIMF